MTSCSTPVAREIGPSPPPVATVSLLLRLRTGLFSSIPNAFVTIALGFILIRMALAFAGWAVFDATFVGTTRSACLGDGACWPFISTHLGQFAYGRFPLGERWRVDLAVVLLITTILYLLVGPVSQRWLALFALFVLCPVIGTPLLAGGMFGLSSVPTEQWGGLALNLVLSYCSIVGSIPLGILLALGRRSRLPLIRGICVTIIEFFRGVPLVTILFTAMFMMPIVLPEGVSLDKLLRAIVALIVFYAAYVAEVVRGGLQALPRGQFEATRSLGLRYVHAMALIILPQALRLVLPGIINIVISMVKDSALVTIIGLFDILGTVKQSLGNPEWLGLSTEGYFFVSVVFFTMCLALSSYSRRIEHRAPQGRAGY
jgi:general L-amino acid transport system permease protein